MAAGASSTATASSQSSFSLSSPLKSSFFSNNNFLCKNKSLNFSTNSRQKTLVLAPKSCLNLPILVRSPAGRSLSSVIQNDPDLFYNAVAAELNRVVEDKDAAFARLSLSLGSRIASLKEAESQLEVEDVLYMIILYKFSEIRVPMVPTLSKCLYNNRLEIIPSKDWELESIHSVEALEMVRQHMTVAFGWNPSSSVTVNWSTIKVPRPHLSEIYARSIFYGYFLKSASVRFRLEHNLPQVNQTGSWTPLPSGFENAVVHGDMSTPRSTALSQLSHRPDKTYAKLSSYVTGFDTETKEVCAKLRTEEAVKVVEKHCHALFGSENDEVNKFSNDEMILTSISSLKRLVLEAVAFGCFLWDAEQYVSGVYELKDRQTLDEI